MKREKRARTCYFSKNSSFHLSKEKSTCPLICNTSHNPKVESLSTPSDTLCVTFGKFLYSFVHKANGSVAIGMWSSFCIWLWYWHLKDLADHSKSGALSPGFGFPLILPNNTDETIISITTPTLPHEWNLALTYFYKNISYKYSLNVFTEDTHVRNFHKCGIGGFEILT